MRWTRLAIAVMLAWASAVRGQVELRRGEGPPVGDVVLVDAEGVHVRVPGEARGVVIPWDRVARLAGEHGAQAERFAGVAEKAWRARIRLERDDSFAAEPLFEELFAGYRNGRGATAMLVSEGLLRCRLRRGAQVLAIDAWLAWLSARAPGPDEPLHVDWALEAGLVPVFDESTGLAPGIPPVWMAWRSVRELARSEPPPMDSQATIPQVLARLYWASARFEAGLDAPIPDATSVEESGIELVRAIVQSRASDDAGRAEGRAWLRARLATNPPPWVEAWCRTALGRSLLREPAEREHAVIELLGVPARLGQVHPYLAGIALAESADALRKSGDPEGAASLLLELRQLYRGHPALEVTNGTDERP